MPTFAPDERLPSSATLLSRQEVDWNLSITLTYPSSHNPSSHPIYPFSTARQPPSPPETAHLVIYHSCHMLHWPESFNLAAKSSKCFFPSITEVYQLQMLHFELNLITLGEIWWKVLDRGKNRHLFFLQKIKYFRVLWSDKIMNPRQWNTMGIVHSQENVVLFTRNIWNPGDLGRGVLVN